MEGTHIDPLSHQANSQEEPSIHKNWRKTISIKCVSLWWLLHNILSHLCTSAVQKFYVQRIHWGTKGSFSLSPATKLCFTGNGGCLLTFLMELIYLGHRKYFSQPCSMSWVSSSLRVSIRHNYGLDVCTIEQWLLQKEQDWSFHCHNFHSRLNCILLQWKWGKKYRNR